jgi:Zn-dependent protease with chaperone function
LIFYLCLASQTNISFMNTFAYPPSPVNVDSAKLAPSSAFRRQAWKVILSIILFFIVYILLVAAAVALTAACFFGGVWIIAARPSFITLMLGLGLMGLGLAVLFFVIKFIFAVSKKENPYRVEVTEEQQPVLFAFIRQLTLETQTAFPKKIFLSSDVNACVFYNSGFWSMFLPVKKNLEIGLGLVNAVNIGEFKAVMAHEFGHFSQRSMKLGSFTYNVNQIIYNMLYDNSGYSKMLGAWGNVSGYFALFASITVKIAEGIQGILKGMYKGINKNYMALSREMEYHADTIAASVSGGNNLVSALSRIEVAAGCYSTALNNAGEWLKEKKITDNIFHHHLSVYQNVARENELGLTGGLPDISFQFIQSFSHSRVNFKNQWASHPELAERKEHLEKINVNATSDERTAWEIFTRKEELQAEMTQLIYANAKVEAELEKKEAAYFEEWYNKEINTCQLPLAYNGFYNNRFTEMKDWDINSLAEEQSSQNFDTIFSDENGQLHATAAQNQADIDILQAIKDRHIDVRSFDFDGVKYKVSECSAIIEKLENEIAVQKDKLKQLDKAAFVFFCSLPGAKDNMIAPAKGSQALELMIDQYNETANSILKALHPFYTDTCNFDFINATLKKLKEGDETKLKQQFKEFIDADYINESSKNDLLNRLRSFNEKDYAYFSMEQFHNNELEELTGNVMEAADELNTIRLQRNKNMLENQLSFYFKAMHQD